MRALKIFAAMFGLLCFSQGMAQNTRLLTADKHNEYGLVYTLPVTSLRIDVTAEREIYHAGPYYKYAKKYLGTDKVVKQDEEKWAIKSVTVTQVGVSDSEQRYLMQLKAGALTYISVDEDGMLLSINKEVAPPVKEAADEPAGVPRHFTGKEYLQYVNEDFIASQSSAKQAQMISESLMEVRDAKMSLTRGTADTMPTDGRQLELMLNSLSEQEAALEAAFAGSVERETVTHSYTFTPGQDERKVLFRMSDFAGFVGADDYSGDPVYIRVAVTGEGSLPVDAKGEEKKLPKDAVVYNIPGTARVSVEAFGETLYSEEMEFAQFGVQFGLNPQLFSNKKERSYAVFNPVTGALVEIGDVVSDN